MNASIAIAHARLADALDPLLEIGLIASLRLVDVERAVDPQGRAGSPDRYLPFAAQFVDKFAFASRPQNFFDRTSCNIAVSSDKSATIRFSLVFSSSSCRSRRISEGIRPAYFLRQL